MPYIAVPIMLNILQLVLVLTNFCSKKKNIDKTIFHWVILISGIVAAIAYSSPFFTDISYLQPILNF